MEIAKRVMVSIVFLLLFGVLIYVGLQVRDVATAKNYSDYWQEKAFDGGDYTYVVLGDAAALGVGATSVEKSYARLIAEKIRMTGRSVRVVNLAMKDADVLNVINKQLPKVANLKPDLVTVTVGLADINAGISQDSFSYNLKNLFENLPPHVSYIGELPYPLDKRKDQVIQDANSQIRIIAQENGVNVVPLYSATYQKNFDVSNYDWDLIYPSDKGHSIWADTFWATIQQ